MKAFLKKLFFSLLLLGMAAGFAGCFNADVDDSEIPWSRPQSWENNAPGLGSGMGGNNF